MNSEEVESSKYNLKEDGNISFPFFYPNNPSLYWIKYEIYDHQPQRVMVW